MNIRQFLAAHKVDADVHAGLASIRITRNGQPIADGATPDTPLQPMDIVDLTDEGGRYFRARFWSVDSVRQLAAR